MTGRTSLALPFDQDPASQINVVAPILAWILPGLGHWRLGHRRRARLIGAGVLGLYFAGLLIGGIDVIDRRDDRWWYYGQVLAGPITPAIDYWINKHLNIRVDKDGRALNPPLKPHPPLLEGDAYYGENNLAFDPDYRPAYTPSLSHMNEVGTLYTTLAAMLNLLAILDVIQLAPGRLPDRRSGNSARGSKREVLAR